MIESFRFVIRRAHRKEFWLFFLASFLAALLIITRNEFKHRFFRMGF